MKTQPTLDELYTTYNNQRRNLIAMLLFAILLQLPTIFLTGKYFKAYGKMEMEAEAVSRGLGVYTPTPNDLMIKTGFKWNDELITPQR